MFLMIVSLELITAIYATSGVAVPFGTKPFFLTLTVLGAVWDLIELAARFQSK
jgi:hypothetical protein